MKEVKILRACPPSPTEAAQLKLTNNFIYSSFKEEFQWIFNVKKVNLDEMGQVFSWLRNEAQCALSFDDLRAIDYCRRAAETSFLKVCSDEKSQEKKKIWKKSQEVSREVTHRFEELRTTRRAISGKFSMINGSREEEKALPKF